MCVCVCVCVYVCVCDLCVLGDQGLAMSNRAEGLGGFELSVVTLLLWPWKPESHGKVNFSLG